MVSKRSPRNRSGARPLPDRDQVQEFLDAASRPPAFRELLRAFNVNAKNRSAFRDMVSELTGKPDTSRTSRGGDRKSLPKVTVIEVSEIDEDGRVIARPASWSEDTPPPLIYINERKSDAAAGPGDRFLARISPHDAVSYRADPIRRIAATPDTIIGIVAEEGRIRSTDRRWRDDLFVERGDLRGAEPGELVVVEIVGNDRSTGRPSTRQGRVTERLGETSETSSFSLIAIHGHQIPVAFSDAAARQADTAGPAPLESRTDLRDLDLVTIDDEDARDFDDAVWAEADPETQGGWKIIVAIADVAWYVRPDDPIDIAAAERGNSVYFPDRVVPMLPEPLSNGWCSLVPDEDRPCLTAHLWIDENGRLTRHRFERAMMRSSARLTYNQVQDARDRGFPDQGNSIPNDAVQALYAAYAVRLKERDKREPLDLDLPEHRVEIDTEGNVVGVGQRQRLDSHRLIEEFMILANIAAAETLELKRQAALFRVHDEPDPKSLDEFRESMRAMGLHLPKGQALKPRSFNQLLKIAETDSDMLAVQEAVLRSQSMATYDPTNIGHFGLALRHYAHFTSPIRRYADLIVHRALISAAIDGDNSYDSGLADGDHDFKSIGEHLSMTERRAEAAERETVRRYTASYLSARQGEVFDGTVAAITRNGMFVRLAELGTDGFMPMRYLPSGWRPAPSHRSRRNRKVDTAPGVGTKIRVKLIEVTPETGSLILKLD